MIDNRLRGSFAAPCVVGAAQFIPRPPFLATSGTTLPPPTVPFVADLERSLGKLLCEHMVDSLAIYVLYIHEFLTQFRCICKSRINVSRIRFSYVMETLFLSSARISISEAAQSQSGNGLGLRARFWSASQRLYQDPVASPAYVLARHFSTNLP